MKTIFLKNKKNILQTIAWILILIAMIFVSTTTQSYGLDGQCYSINGNRSIKYKNCYCDCNKYKRTDQGFCTNCWHRVDETPQKFKVTKKSSKQFVDFDKKENSKK